MATLILIFFGLASVQAQTSALQGQVTNTLGHPIKGATVAVDVAPFDEVPTPFLPLSEPRFSPLGRA